MWKKGNWEKYFSNAAARSVLVNNATFALPINYYQWGFYYLPSQLIKQNETFSNWNNFIDTCVVLDKQGHNLVTIGSKSTWSVAAWFDYLNLRINGIDFHHEVTQGRISFNDPKITKLFTYWQQAIDANCFTPKRSKLTWKQSLPELYHRKAYSTLMGNFFTLSLPEKIQKELKFTAFPTIDESIPRYEEAPMDVIVASINAKDNPAVFTFLDYLVTSDALSDLNIKINKIDPFEHSTTPSDPFLHAGVDLLRSAEDISQFFDRDAPPNFSVPAMKVFTNYLNGDININQAQSKLEALRINVFDPKL
jgi:multiple sugar transport system substrate-binding protein